MERFIQLSMGASMQAWADCGLDIDEELCRRTGVIIGVGMGGLPMIEEQHAISVERAQEEFSFLFLPLLQT